jgi:bifunctional DNA-binding transcriptional regulator/antitoxin component of YhaV-PrlF toxin-antitoxin module
MKLQKHKTRKDEDYYKYVVVLPKKEVEKAGLKEGDELEAEGSKKGVMLRKK